MKSVWMAAVAVGSLGVAEAQVFCLFEFPGSDPAGDAVVPSVEHLNLSPFARVNVGAVSQNDVFASSHWNQGGSLDPAEYVGFSFQPQVGYELKLTRVAWEWSRTTTGPQYGLAELRVNGEVIDGIRATTISTTTAARSVTPNDLTLHASDLAEFRFYGWGASSTGNLRLDNVALSGSLSPVAVPEPKSGALLMAGGALLFGMVRRRQRRS